MLPQPTYQLFHGPLKKKFFLRGGESLDQASQLDTLIFDKTGTLTLGQPEVDDYYLRSHYDSLTVEAIVKSAEFESSHPIAQALLRHLEKTELIKLDRLEDVTGKGLQVQGQGHSWRIGSLDFIQEQIQSPLSPEEEGQIRAILETGATMIYLSCDQDFVGYYVLRDQIKEDAQTAIEELKKMGFKTVMLTGDHQVTASYIADQVGIDEFRAELLPQDKVSEIQKIQARARVLGL